MNDSTNQIEEESRIRSAAFNLTETSGVGMLVLIVMEQFFHTLRSFTLSLWQRSLKKQVKKLVLDTQDSIFEAQWEQELGKGIQNFLSSIMHIP